MKFWSILAALVPVLTLFGAVEAADKQFPNPGACYGECNTHDPMIVRRAGDGVYFRFSTGGKIGIWKAPDLTGPWVYQGAAVPAGSKIDLPGRNDLWAPDVQRIGNQYVLFYSVSRFGINISAIGYATSPTMEAGTWTDHGPTGVQSNENNTWNAIDANVFQDPATGRWVMNFGSFWGCIHQYPMDRSGMKAATCRPPTHIAFNSTGTQALEAAYMHHREGWYYLFFSHGRCCGYPDNMPLPGEEYKVYVCRSRSAKGPFLDRDGRDCRSENGGTLVLASHGYVFGPGHQGILADPKHGTVLYYHYANRNIGLGDGDYQFGWNRLKWNRGWPVAY
ncbi:arabinan endo-1,5-alpha-L-arabinosidase A-like protein [Paramyrothecium foliicola]|nr:arabinan endo-1,5-alpha-L-arabinosidase A-like protein [Paramyrothecium foliicola]